MWPSELLKCNACNTHFFSVPKPFGGHSLNIVKFFSLRQHTAEFLALSWPKSESAKRKNSAGW